MSKKYGIAVYEPEDSDDEKDEEDENDEDAAEDSQDGRDPFIHSDHKNSSTVEPKFNVGMTASALGTHIFNEIGVATPLGDPLGVVLTSRGGSLALVLCDNFHYSARPANEEVEKVQAACEFSDSPSWMLSASMNDWSASKVRSR